MMNYKKLLISYIKSLPDDISWDDLEKELLTFFEYHGEHDDYGIHDYPDLEGLQVTDSKRVSPEREKEIRDLLNTFIKRKDSEE